MEEFIVTKRTTTDDPAFQQLIAALDHELWNELKEDQATYNQYNKVPALPTAVVLYVKDVPAACGCFKEVEEQTVEIKRMFVQKGFRGKGFSKLVLAALEKWAAERGKRFAILETSIHFTVAKRLYLSNGYSVIPNYPPYTHLPESVCMRKSLTKEAIHTG